MCVCVQGFEDPMEELEDDYDDDPEFVGGELEDDELQPTCVYWARVKSVEEDYLWVFCQFSADLGPRVWLHWIERIRISL